MSYPQGKQEISAMDEKLATRLDAQLEAGLDSVDRFINKHYLNNLSACVVEPLANPNADKNNIRMFKIEKFVYDEKEINNDKLISVYSALHGLNGTVFFIIDGDESGNTSIYIGVRASNSNASTLASLLENNFRGNFPGSQLTLMKTSDVTAFLTEIGYSPRSLPRAQGAEENRNVATVSIVPAMRDENKEKFVQSIEKFIDAMEKKRYTAVLIAEPVDAQQLESLRRGYEELYSSISPFAKYTLAYNKNTSNAVSSNMFENFSHSVNNGVTTTSGHSTGTTITNTQGDSSGTNMGFPGFGWNYGKNRSTSKGYSSGQNWSRAVTSGTAETTGGGQGSSVTNTEGDGRTLTIDYKNRSVEEIMTRIDEQLKRIRKCEVFGLWNFAAYFISEESQNAVMAASSYRSLMLGEKTGVEKSFINCWNFSHTGESQHKSVNDILIYLKNMRHPRFEIGAASQWDSNHNPSVVKLYATPGNMVSGMELPLLVGMPKKSINGMPVMHIPEFGRNIRTLNGGTIHQPLEIGCVRHMGNNSETPVALELQDLTAHCFITGSTGSGKSTTVYKLLFELYKKQKTFLVIEPAKGEYKNQYANLPDVNIFTTNPYVETLLKINPFRFPEEIHVLEHLDRLIEIFNACWEMYAAMPALLKEAMEKIYEKKGWDLLHSVYTRGSIPEYPTMADLVQVLPELINASGYSSDTKGDYTGALVTRVRSLTNGISGQIFCGEGDIDDDILFDQNTIIDLSRVGSMETKSLIMGLLVLKLSEYRMATAGGQANQALKHVTVLEEAHNLLKNTTRAQGDNRLVGKSVEMICNSIAEMRTYGEGFIIVDQSPTSVDISAIKNTNTKIVMRLPEKEDCEVAGSSMALNQEQIRELSRLERGVAVVMQNNWQEPILTMIRCHAGRENGPDDPNQFRGASQTTDFSALKTVRHDLVVVLMTHYQDLKHWTGYEQDIRSTVENSRIHGRKAKALIRETIAMVKRLQDSCTDSKNSPPEPLLGESFKQISGMSMVFDSISDKLHEDYLKENYTVESMALWYRALLQSTDRYVGNLGTEDNCYDNFLYYMIAAETERMQSIAGQEAKKIDYRYIRQSRIEIKKMI